MYFHALPSLRRLSYVLALAAAGAAGCSESSTTQIQPTPVKCAVALEVAPGVIASAGGGAAITVTTQAECAWSATSEASWITGMTPAAGQGAAQVGITVTPNPDARTREGSVNLNGTRVSIRQEAATCALTAAPTSHTLPLAGGTGTINVTTLSGCAWTATTSATWITILTGSAGSESGPVTFRAAANTGLPRVGTITIGAQVIVVVQEGVTPPSPVPCTFAVAPASASAAASATTAEFTVTAPATCPWTAVSQAVWMTVTSGTTGSGPGPVTLTVAANPGPPRSGTALVAGQTVTVNQAGGCTFAISPVSRTVPATAGASAPITLTTSAGCPWTATSQAAWLTITSPASGTGNSTIGFTVGANTGPQRTGTLTVGGQLFTVTQESGCAVTIDPASRTAPPGGGPSTPPIGVTAPAGCGWTSTSQAAWLTITAGATGTGNGSVEFSVAANPGPQRVGTLTIGGQTFTVTQQSGCAVAINPTSRTVPAAGGPSTPPIAVTAAAGCAWTSTRNDDWLTITAGASGTGNGSVEFSVAANAGPQRVGTLTIGGQTFTVTQQSGCAVAINPTSRTVPAAGGPSTPPIAVTAAAGCTWTSTSNDGWLTITAGASGSGNGSVSFTVAANTGPQRIGTLTIGGQTLTVTQQSGCTVAINPTSRTAPAAGGPSAPSIAVTAPAGCTWTATSNDGWLTITAGASGSGNGSVSFTVAANTGPQRLGTLTIGGQTFTVTQQNGCTYSLDRTSAQFDDDSHDNERIRVTAATGCTWTAVSQVPWITIRSGASGSGNGEVRYDVAQNPGPPRVGTIIVAGITFTVNQDDDQ